MFRPCIDLHNGKVKQIVGGTLTDCENILVENFVSDQSPAFYAELFKRDHLAYGHIIMLGKGNEEAALEAIRAYPKGLQIGGGINPENALFYLEQGATHVIITSYVFNDGKIDFDHLEKIVNTIGKNRLVLDLSCRLKNDKYYVVTDRWQKFTEYELNQENIGILEGYCDEFLIHGVDVEGKQQGIDENLLELIRCYTKIPVTYAGGIKSLEDIFLINKLGQGRIHFTVGSALNIFGGQLDYDTVVEFQNKIQG